MTQDWTGDLNSIAVGASKEIRALLAELQKGGLWEGRRKAGNHIQLRCVSGRGLATVALTPSDWRTVKNIRSDIRRAEKL